MDYFLQLTTEKTDVIKEIPVREPEPVKTSPTLTPDSVGAWSVQAVLITFLMSFGKPLMDKVFIALNEGAKNKALKEDKALDAQLKQTALLQEAFTDQQTFFQEMIKESQVRSTAAVVASTAQTSEVLATLTANLHAIEDKVVSNNDFLSQIAEMINTGKPILISIDKIGGVVSITHVNPVTPQTELSEGLQDLKNFISDQQNRNGGNS